MILPCGEKYCITGITTMPNKMLQLQPWITRKENKVLNSKVERLNTFKLDYGRQKTELKNTTTALHNEKIKNSQLSGELSLLRNVKILIDGTPDDASRVMDSEESMDFETLKKCFMIMKRDFGNSMKTEAKLKTDYSRLASFTKVLEKKNADLTEKCSIQHRIIEAYKSDLRSSTKRSLPVESSPPESTDDVETNLQPTPAKKVAPRRSPRNLIKRSTFPIECKVSTSRQLTYDGLGGHSEQDKFPAKLKPCRIVSNRRK